MKITPELLQKYASSSCTEDEKKAIELWLLSTDEEAMPIAEIQLQLSEKKIWGRILPVLFSEKVSRTIPLYQKITRYAVASCVAIGLVAVSAIQVCNTGFMSTEIAFINTENTSKYIQTAGMNFALMPDSKVDVITNLCKTESKIAFCGSIELTNKANTNVQYEILTSCRVSSDSIRKVSLKKNVHYYVFAITDKQGNEKIHIYNEEDVLLFFPPGRVPKHILKSVMG